MEHKNIVTIILVIGLALTAAILAVNMSSNEKIVTVGTEQQRNTISVSGQGKAITQPDKAEIYVKINTEGSTATAAKDANSKISEQVIKALNNKGAQKKDIETTYYYLSKKQEWSETERKFIDKGYEVNNQLKITTKNLDTIGDLIDTSVNAGANGVDSVSFGLTEEKQREVNKEALSEASKNAEDKAEAITESIGVNLGKLVTISESNFNYIPYVMRDAQFEKAAGALAPDILPQTLEITATVNLIYEIK